MESRQIIDRRTGDVYGDEPPTRSQLSSKTDEIIDEIEALKAEIEELKKPKYESGYLRSIYG